MIKQCASVLIVCLCAIPLFAGGSAEEVPDDAVELTLGSWRTDDVDQMGRILSAFHEEHPNIRVNFDPTNPPDYNATLRLQLESGTGPDVFYSRSYETGRDLFADGYKVDLGDQAFVSERFDRGTLEPWQTAEGAQFGMPLLAVSHGVYYNVELFDELGLSIPETWDEFFDVAETIADAGYIPVANGLADEWDITEVFWMNIAPSVIGGAEGRSAYEAGERPFNDDAIVEVFETLARVEPYLPDGYEAISYNDSKALFQLQDAAMWFDGSWTVSEFDAQGMDFDWSIFAPPAPAGGESRITFHPDAGIAINPDSPHQEEALTFLEWLSGPEASAMFGNELAGFFPMVADAPELENERANTFLQLNEGRETDVRFTWPVLMSGDPSAYELIQQGSIGVITGGMTPREAADALHEGVMSWYTP